MKAIYEPSGKAKEYGNLACNLYKGCGHKCSYCYAPRIIRMDRQEFYNNPQPREGIIEALRKDAKRIGDKYKHTIISWKGLAESLGRQGKSDEIPSIPPRPEVFLCFTCDPYQPINEKYKLTRQAIEILHANDIAVNILTKGKIPDADFELLAKRPDLSKIGITLTGAGSTDFEDDAPYELNRLAMLERASWKRYGLKTWVSMEPIIKPDYCLEIIKGTHHITGEYKLGKWNYDPRANDIDWHKFVNEAIELLEKLNCKYYIKEDLRRYI
jgi:DNA repair photolyase